MTRLIFVRHGRATGGWDHDVDPGLDEVGLRQAQAVADRLAPLGRRPVIASPMRRAQLTAAPLAARWGLDVVTDPGFTEIPSPDGVPVNDRVGWLRRAMRGTWADLGPRYTRYRDEVVAAAVAVETDSVIVSHFVSINVVIGACLGDDRLVIASLDNGSATIIDHDEHGFRLIESGHEADTLIR